MPKEIYNLDATQLVLFIGGMRGRRNAVYGILVQPETLFVFLH